MRTPTLPAARTAIRTWTPTETPARPSAGAAKSLRRAATDAAARIYRSRTPPVRAGPRSAASHRLGPPSVRTSAGCAAPMRASTPSFWCRCRADSPPCSAASRTAEDPLPTLGLAQSRTCGAVARREAQSRPPLALGLGLLAAERVRVAEQQMQRRHARPSPYRLLCPFDGPGGAAALQVDSRNAGRCAPARRVQAQRRRVAFLGLGQQPPGP